MKSLFAVLFTLFIVNSSHALDFKGVQFDDEVKVGTTALKLNGIGIRKVLVLHVYYAGLYVEVPTTDAQAILNSPSPKILVMHFKRWVEKSKILDAWEEGFAKNKEEGYDWKTDFNKLKEVMVHMKENERMVLTFLPTGAEIKVKDSAPLKIEGANFSKVLLKVFINNAPDTDLKKGLLGLKK